MSPIFQARLHHPDSTTLKAVAQVISQALQWDTWQPFDLNIRYQPLALGHYGMVQRWLVVYSQAALERAEATLKKVIQRENEALTKQLFHLQAKRFGTPQAADQALAVWPSAGSITALRPLI